MKYSSTRGGVQGLSCEEAVMMGLAEDGGLLLPDQFPRVDGRLSEWKELGFQQLCLEIMELFIGEDLKRPELQLMIESSCRGFRRPEVTPLRK